MVGTNVKQETMTVMEKRTGIEAELDVIISRLCRPNGPGLSGNLVDKDVSSLSFLSQYPVSCPGLF